MLVNKRCLIIAMILYIERDLALFVHLCFIKIYLKKKLIFNTLSSLSDVRITHICTLEDTDESSNATFTVQS